MMQKNDSSKYQSMNMPTSKSRRRTNDKKFDPYSIKTAEVKLFFFVVFLRI